MMTTTRLFGLSVSVLSVLVLRGVAAGTCAPGIQSTHEHMAASDAVFVGRVVEIRSSQTSGQPTNAGQAAVLPPEVVFDVKVAWKGIHEPRIATVNHVIFEAPVSVGGEYLVFAKRSSSGARLQIMGCGETKPSDQAAEDIRALGGPQYASKTGDTR